MWAGLTPGSNEARRVIPRSLFVAAGDTTPVCATQVSATTGLSGVLQPLALLVCSSLGGAPSGRQVLPPGGLLPPGKFCLQGACSDEASSFAHAIDTDNVAMHATTVNHCLSVRQHGTAGPGITMVPGLELALP